MTDMLPDKKLDDKISKLEEEFSKLNQMFNLTKIINQSADVKSFIDELVSFLSSNLDSQNCICFVNENGKYNALSYMNIEVPDSMALENDDGGIWQVFLVGKPFLVLNENDKNMYQQFFESNNLMHFDSRIILPFAYRRKILAIVSFGPKRDGEYKLSDLDLLAAVSNYISPVLYKFLEQKEKEVKLTELQKTLHNLSILYNIGQAMNFIDDLKRLLNIILDKAIKTIGAEKGSLMLYNYATEDLVVRVVYGLQDKEEEERINNGLVECTRIKVGEGIAGMVFATKTTMITNLGSNDPRFKQADNSRVFSILCVPIIVKGEAIGVINITNKLNGQLFNKDDADFMEALAGQAAIAIDNAQLYELATKDGLTKLYIYRHFNFLLEEELKRSKRYQHPVSLIMMDIDNFKVINDSFGHQVGDEMLKEIAKVITNTCRKIDLPSRYGGEEFAVILPETTIENTRKIAERLRQRIAAIVIYAKDNTPVSPTISIGCAGYPIHAETREDLISASDQALYHAKKNGKNRVAEYNQDGCEIVTSFTDLESDS